MIERKFYKMKQTEILQHKFIKLSGVAGIIFALMILHFLTVNTNAQVVAARPGAYNTRINYGSTRSEGLIGEDRGYETYQRRVSLYYQAKRLLINEEWQDCYRHATNAAQSKVCSDTSQRDISDLEMDIKRIRDAAYIEYLRRKELIIEYWNKQR